MSNLSRYVATAVVLFCLWLLLTSSGDLQEVLAGAVLAMLVAGLGYKGFTRRGLGILSPRRLARLLALLGRPPLDFARGEYKKVVLGSSSRSFDFPVRVSLSCRAFSCRFFSEIGFTNFLRFGWCL